jgi:electron transport complex protein RnfG
MSGQAHSPMQIGARLFAICTAAALGLGFVNEITEPRIAAEKGAERQQVLASFIDKGEARAGVPGSGGVEEYYTVADGDKVLGYVLALTGTGYGGDLKLLAYYGVDGTIRAARLVDDQETPGLGKKAETEQYMAMFTGTGGSRPVPVTKAMLAADQPSQAPTGARTAAGAPRWVSMSRAGLNGWLFGEAAGAGSPADTVTGATITFKGVSAALAEGSRFVKGLGGRK